MDRAAGDGGTAGQSGRRSHRGACRRPGDGRGGARVEGNAAFGARRRRRQPLHRRQSVRGSAMADDGEETKRAVAVRWEGVGTPTVVAKGEGHVAEAIVTRAREAGVAVEENPLLAKALAAVELDRPIPEVLFKAVAEVIAFVLRASGKRP
ncbi:MAG: hypothetical protein GX458_06275 [Phyllobacteriaceae bacterium]|nr:hypothetical protein [Phyllobacteriaceae bacterium]